MSNDIKVIVIDNETSVREHICDVVRSIQGFKIIGEASNGLEGLKLIDENDVDLVILDYMLPQLDGLSLIRRYRGTLHTHKAAFLMLTGYYSDAMASEARVLKVECLLQKPLSKSCLEERLCIFKNAGQFYTAGNSDRRFSSLLAGVTRILVDNSFSISYKGFSMLRDAVIIALEHEGDFSGITKIIYPELAKKYNKTVQSVERNIRCVINSAWKNNEMNGKYPAMRRLFERCPTNSETVFAFADIIRLERIELREVGL